jgi:hypothetical protein
MMLVTKEVRVMELNLGSWSFVPASSAIAAQRANNMSAQGKALGLRFHAMFEP